MTQIIQVSLDTTKKPPVIVKPAHPNVQRHVKIQWTQVVTNEHFTFYSFTPKENPSPFSNIVLSDQQITANYDANAAGEHGYVIVVTATADGKHYSSAAITNGGGPTIKNR
jgi:hypothetical protein